MQKSHMASRFLKFLLAAAWKHSIILSYSSLQSKYTCYE